LDYASIELYPKSLFNIDQKLYYRKIMKIKNKKLAAAVLLVIVLTFGSYNALASLSDWLARIDNYRDICVHEAYAIITYQPYRNVTILDVRTQGEYDIMHINNSILIPYEELEARIGELAGNETYEIIVYCKSGYRSAVASDILASHAFERVYNMVGGITAWVDAGYPVIGESPTSYTDISVHEAYDMITSGDYPDRVILDVRTQSVYDAMHIENATLIPYDQLQARIGGGWMAGNETHEIIVYCTGAGCAKSEIACQTLVSKGFSKVYNMVGGIEAWVDAGYPVIVMLLLNPSVEQGVGAPSFWGKGKYADVPGDHVWSETPHTGLRSLALIISPNSAATRWHGINWYQKHNLDDITCPFTRGGTYTFRAWYQTSDCQMTLYAGMWREGYVWIGAEALFVRSATPETWEQSPWITFTIPADAKYIAIGMNIKLSDIDPGMSQALGRADDFEVQEAS